MAESTESTSEETYELTREQVEVLVNDIHPKRKDLGLISLLLTSGGAAGLVHSPGGEEAIIAAFVLSAGLYFAHLFEVHEVRFDDLTFGNPQSFDEWADE